MSTNILNSLKVAGLSILVAVLGGIIQALTNFHPSDQTTQLIMTVLGGTIIGILNQFMHTLQGTTIVKSSEIKP